MPTESQQPPVTGTEGRPGAAQSLADPASPAGPAAPARARLDLAQLWRAHPDSHDQPFPCRSDTGRPYFQNQCAIKMGLALAAGGADLKRLDVAAGGAAARGVPRPVGGHSRLIRGRARRRSG